MDSLQLLVLWDKPSSSKDQSRASAEITATLNGIHIQGARMASGVGIDECYPDTPSWNLIPHCYLSWLPVDDVVRTTSIVFIRLRIFLTKIYLLLFAEVFSDQWVAYRESATVC